MYVNGFIIQWGQYEILEDGEWKNTIPKYMVDKSDHKL